MFCAWHGRLGDAGRANINLQRLHLLPPPHLSSLLFFVTRVAPNVGRGGDGNRGRSRLSLGYDAAAGRVVHAAKLGTGQRCPRRRSSLAGWYDQNCFIVCD